MLMFDEMSFGQFLLKCHRAMLTFVEMSVGKMSFGKMSFGKMSFGKVSFDECCLTNVVCQNNVI